MINLCALRFLIALSQSKRQFFLFIGLLPQLVFGQISLVKDICTLYDGSQSGINAVHTVSFNGSLIFSGRSEKGQELMISDGTAAGTQLLKDIYPGAEASYPREFIKGENLLYFSAVDGLTDNEKLLWRTDGTANGTFKIKCIDAAYYADAEYTFLKDLTPVGESLYYLVRYRVNFTEYFDLWVTDGTVNGATLVKTKIKPNNTGKFAAINGTVYFTAKDDVYGTEIWKTDGTPAGTSIIGELLPGPDVTGTNKEPYALQALNSTLYFLYYTNNSIQLWKSDGTITGSQVLSTESGLTNFAYVTGFYAANGTLFLNAGTSSSNVGLWMTKTNSEIISFVNTNRPRDNFTDSTIPANYIAIDTTLYYFTANKIWKSDGTVAGTIPLVESGWSTFPAGANYFTAMNGSLYFVAMNASGQYTLWRSDGTPESTLAISNFAIDDIVMSAVPSNFATLNRELFFTVDDAQTGNELWKTNGDAGAAQMVTDYPMGSYVSYISEFEELNGNVFFPAADATKGIELFVSDGTEAGTFMLKDINVGADRYSGSLPSELFRFDNFVFFKAYTPSTGYEMWKTDGTAAGTVIFKDIIPGSGSSSPGSFFQYKNKFVFTTYGTPRQLWISDGTAVNTNVLGYSSSLPCFTVYKDKLYFNREQWGTEPTSGLWVTDGTIAETKLIKNFYNLYKIITLGNKLLLFSQMEGFQKSELWISDGTNAGTTKVIDNLTISSPSAIEINGVVYFTAGDGIHGVELWKTDGTSAGTVMVHDINIGSSSSIITDMIALDSTLIFSADDGVHGKELWKSNGTADGTQLIMDIYTGIRNSDPKWFVYKQGYVYFLAYDGVNRSLYKTNGNSCGTIKVTTNTDVNLDFYHAPLLVGNRFFLGGERYNIGSELFIHNTELDLPVAEGCRQTQSIVFDQPANLVMGSEGVAVTASSTSGLPVVFELSNANASITENVLVAVLPGTITITAKQAGNNAFEAAADVQYTFCVNPAKPTISTFNSSSGHPLLVSSSEVGNQWYINNELIEEATLQELEPNESGEYTVQVTINECVSSMSDNLVIVITGIGPEGTSKPMANVYPTIVNDQVVKIEFAEQTTHTIEVISVSGVTMLKTVSTDTIKELHVQHLPVGIYLIRVANSSDQFISRFVKK